MANSKHLLDDVEFIFSECVRFQQLQQEWLETRECPEELHRAFLYEIRHPTDRRRKITYGRAAMARLEALATVAAQRAGIVARSTS